MGEWKTKVGDTVDIGQELGTILTSEGRTVESGPSLPQDESVRLTDRTGTVSPGKPSADGKEKTAIPAATSADSRRDARHHRQIEPALSPTITRKLSRVIPANLQMDARWDAIRKARDAAKKKNGKNAPSPSVMIAWSVVRAMEKHAPFRRLILEDESIVENENFDLGIAVTLGNDRLASMQTKRIGRSS